MSRLSLQDARGRQLGDALRAVTKDRLQHVLVIATERRRRLRRLRLSRAYWSLWAVMKSVLLLFARVRPRLPACSALYKRRRLQRDSMASAWRLIARRLTRMPPPVPTALSRSPMATSRSSRSRLLLDQGQKLFGVDVQTELMLGGQGGALVAKPPRNGTHIDDRLHRARPM